MAINPYFRSNYNGNADQNLMEDLIVEGIRIYGIDCEFCPYSFVNEDKLFGEDPQLEYKKAWNMELYLESVTGWEGTNDIVQKLGLIIEEKGNFLVSMKRFRQCVEYTQYRPREKDLIYFPITDSLYEITFVEHEKIFHQLGGISNLVYSMRIDLMTYSNQCIRTGVREIDRFESERAFTVKFVLNTGTGRYLVAESVYQGNTLSDATAKATVIHYDRDNKILTVKDVIGTFNNTLPIKGATSGVIYTIANSDARELPNEPTSDNKQIYDTVIGTNTTEPIIDWSETSPFGSPKK